VLSFKKKVQFQAFLVFYEVARRIDRTAWHVVSGQRSSWNRGAGRAACTAASIHSGTNPNASSP
jgi:hypothetical protein